MEAEQAKHIGKCLYHLSKSHQSSDCYIKKECDEILAAKKPQESHVNATSATSGQLRNIKEEIDDEPVMEDDAVESFPDCNDTNDEDLFYFARIKNHYLRLVRSSTNGLQSRHSMQYPVIVDSGANYSSTTCSKNVSFLSL